MSKIKIISLNTRGVRNVLKRRKVWNYLRAQRADICLIQETHGANNDNFMWANMWGNKCVFANGNTNARGVAILFNKHVDSIREIIRDVDGRYLIVKLEINEYTYCIANVYAPNNDQPSFFNDVFNKI